MSRSGIAEFDPGQWEFPTGTALAMPAGMSPMGRILGQRFEEICRSELNRLRRKTAAFSAAERAELDDISLSVVHAIAERLGEAVDRHSGDDIGNIISHLFAVGPEQGKNSVAGVAERETT